MSDMTYRPGQPYQFFAQEVQEANYNSMGLNGNDTFLGRRSPQREENVYVMAPFGYAQETRPTTPTPNYVPYSGPIPFFGYEQQDLPEKKPYSSSPHKCQEDKLKKNYKNKTRSKSRDKAESHSPSGKDETTQKNDASYSRGHSRNRSPKQKYSDDALYKNSDLKPSSNYNNNYVYNSYNRYNNYNSSYNNTFSDSNNNNNDNCNSSKCYLRGRSRNASPKLNRSIEEINSNRKNNGQKKSCMGNGSQSENKSVTEYMKRGKSQSPQCDHKARLVDKSTSSHDQSSNTRKRENQNSTSDCRLKKIESQQAMKSQNKNEMSPNKQLSLGSMEAKSSDSTQSNEMLTRTKKQQFYNLSSKMKPPWQPDKVIIDMQQTSKYDNKTNDCKTLPRIPVPLLDEGFDLESDLQPWPRQKPKEVQKIIPHMIRKKVQEKMKPSHNVKQKKPEGVYDGPNWTYEVVKLTKPGGIYEKSTKWSYNRPSDLRITVGNVNMTPPTADMKNYQGLNIPNMAHFNDEVEFFPSDFYWENEAYNVPEQTRPEQTRPSRPRNCKGMSEEWEARNFHEEKDGKPVIKLRDVNEDAEPAFLRPDIGVYRRKELDPTEVYGRTKGLQKAKKVTNFKDNERIYDPRFRTVDPCNRLNPPYSKHTTKRELPPPRADMDSPQKKEQVVVKQETPKPKEPRPEMDFSTQKSVRSVLPCNDRNFRVPTGAHPELLMEHRNFCQKPYREPIVLCDAAAMANIGRHLIWSEDNERSPCELRTTVAPQEDKKMIKFQILEGGIYKSDTAAQTALSVNTGVLCEFTANVPPRADSLKVVNNARTTEPLPMTQTVLPPLTAPLPPVVDNSKTTESPPMTQPVLPPPDAPLPPANELVSETGEVNKLVSETAENILVPVKSKSIVSIAAVEKTEEDLQGNKQEVQNVDSEIEEE